MRAFMSVDGHNWTASIYDGPSGDGSAGWEVILFDEDGGGRQRIAYRPAGWLQAASVAELVNALQEGESVRTRWESR